MLLTTLIANLHFLNAQESTAVPRKISLIKPGTIISNQAPEGWSYMLFRNTSTVGAGDLDAASNTIKHLANFLGSVMVAQVESTSPRGAPANFIIKDVGYGLFSRVGQLDKVVSSATYQQLGAKFGLLESIALSSAEKRLNSLLITAQTPTMSIVDSPTMVFAREKHVEVTVRHAILVDSRTGNVVTLIWFIEPGTHRQPHRVISDIDVFPANADISIVLHLDRREFALGVITERALALNGMTWSKTQIPMPQETTLLSVLPSLSSAQSTQLESQLRALLAPK
jgi:hypothetical protein